MWNNIIYNWNFTRILRLGLGILIIVEGVRAEMWIMVVLGALFTLMPALNMGCGASGNCAVPTRKTMSATTEDDRTPQ